MNVFYLPAEQIFGEVGELPEDEARHAIQVLRYREGDEIRCIDGQGGCYEGVVSRAAKKQLQLKITAQTTEEPVQHPVTLAMGYIRQKQRLEFAVEKMVELGVDHISIFHGDHSEPGKVRNDRMEGVIKAASKQSGRSRFPSFASFNSLDDFLSASDSERLIAAHEKVSDEKKQDKFEREQSLSAVVGPEGGLSDREVDLIKENQGELISLGERRLRAETAVIALAVLLK